MAVKKKSKKSEAVATPVETPVMATPVEAVVETFEGTRFHHGVIIKDGNSKEGRWTASLKGCKGTAVYVSKKGTKATYAILNYFTTKDDRTLYTLVFIDKRNPERVSGLPERDQSGQLRVGFPAFTQADVRKPGSGFIESVNLFPVG